MSRGKRYDENPKLNMKKVVAVIVAFIVIIMFVFVIKGILEKGANKGKIESESYYAAFKDNKWGVINSRGENVIEPSYQEMIIVPNSKSDVFLCTYDVNYETGEYKTKVLNSKNEEILKDYDKVETIGNHDENNNLWYEENVLKIEKDNKYGLINLLGKEILKPEYDEIEAVLGIKNALKIKKDNKFGIIDNEGKNIIDINYKEIDNLGKDYKSGYIVQSEDGKYGIVSYLNENILEPKYDKIEKVYGNGMYVIIENGKQKLVKKGGEEVLIQNFDKIVGISKAKEDGAGVIFTKDNKYGFMNLKGEVLIDATYEELKEAKQGVFIAKKDGKYGIIDLSKTEKLGFNFQSIVYYENADIYVAEDEKFNANILNGNFETKLTGILLDINTDKGYIKLRVGEEYKYYNLKFEEKNASDIFTANTLFLSKKDGKYGFVDKDGKVIIDYIYDDATEQNSCGYAGIKKDGKWGSVDNKGNVVIEPIYNLDDYLLIDFIGKWHLGQDINMNYYNTLND